MNLRTKIAEHIRQDIEGFPPGTPLPPVRELAASLSVSPPTVMRALRALAAESRITIHQGRRATVADELFAAKTTLELPARSNGGPVLLRHLLTSIADGLYPAGEPLPKRASLADRFGVASRTVTHAFRILAKRGLIRRNGNSWVVGGPLPNVDVRGNQTPSTILVICTSVSRWLETCTGRRTGAFGTQFLHEARKAETRVQLVHSGRAIKDVEYDLSTASLRPLLAELGDRYLGGLVVIPGPHLKNYAQQLHFLCDSRRPVVWFDAHDVDPISSFRGPMFTRCHFSERAALRVAVKSLVERGHRCVGFPLITGATWIESRARAFAAIGAASTPPLQVKVSSPPARVLDEIDKGELERFLSAQPRTSPLLVPALPGLAAPKRQTQVECTVDEIRAILARVGLGSGDERIKLDRLISHTPTMLQLLSDPAVTAIISPNDRMGYSIWAWLASAGWSVPTNITLLSFDNRVDRIPHDLATIEFGFDYLGYAAFHTILGDVSLRRRVNGDITARPRLIEGRSLGAPSSRRR